MGFSRDTLHDRVAIVTGASQGIGRAIAVELARVGAHGVVCGRRLAALKPVADEVRTLGRRALAVACDVADADQVCDVVAQTLGDFGRIDLLVNNAGLIKRAPAVEAPLDDWETVIGVNLTSVFRLCQEAGKRMLAQGRGKIVNIASLLSFQGGITVPAYAASKGGVAQLTKALANEWAGKGVNVNAIAPGYIHTDNTAALAADPVRNAQITVRIPAGRWGEPADLGGAAVFLAARASDYVNGHVLVVDGGWMGR